MIIDEDIYAKDGDALNKYFVSNGTLDTIILRFDSMEGMMNMHDIMDQVIKAIIPNEVQSSNFVA